MRTAAAFPLLLCVLLACGSPREEPTQELAPEVVAEPGVSPPPRHEEAPADPPTPDPTPSAEAPRVGEVEVVDLPDVVPALPTVRTTTRQLPTPPDSWADPPRHPVVTLEGEPERAARVNAYLAELVTSTEEDLSASCQALLATSSMISVACDEIDIYERGGSDVHTRIHNLAIEGEAVSSFELHDAIRPTANLDAKLRAACERVLRRELDSEYANVDCQFVDAANVGLSPRGVVGSIDVEGYRARFTVPFAELDRAVYADSPLGRALAALPGASLATVELPPGFVRAGTRVEGLAFGAAGTARVVLGRWMLLPVEARRGLVLAGHGRELRLGLPSDAQAELEARRAALGEAGEVAEWSASAVPRLVRTRVETAFRNSPNTNSQRVLLLPPGTLVAVALGRVDGRQSSMGERRTWALTAAAPGVSGYTAGNLLVEHEGCEPPIRPFVDAMPEAQRPTAESTLLRAQVSLRRGGRVQEAIAYGAAGRSNRPQRLGVSRVELYEPAEGCALGRRLARYDLEGNLAALRFPTTSARGGSSLVLLGSYIALDRIRWQLFALGSGEALWTHEAPVTADVRVGELVEGEHYPVIVEGSGSPIRVAWVDGRVEVR